MRLLRVIERMYRLNLSIYDVNPVKNVIHSINSLHVEDSCNVISLDDVLLNLNTPDHGENLREESEYGCTTRQFWHARAFKCYVFGKGHLGQVLCSKAIQIGFNHSDFLFS